MFNLLIVGVLSLDGLVMSLVNGLVFSDGSGDWYIFNSLLGNMFHILSFIGYLVLSDNCFIISVSFLNGDILNVALSLGLSLLDNLSGLDI